MSLLLTLTKAAAKKASAKLREMGLFEPRVDWATRATICEQCPLRVVHKKISYCGRPFLQQIDRDDSIDGCGCPIRAKAMDPAEHCPITPRHEPASTGGQSCDCKWCAAQKSLPAATTPRA